MVVFLVVTEEPTSYSNIRVNFKGVNPYLRHTMYGKIKTSLVLLDFRLDFFCIFI